MKLEMDGKTEGADLSLITNSNYSTNEDRKLKKELGIFDLFMIGITGVIGSGWLFAPMYAAKLAGPSAIISWIIGGFLVLLVGLIFSHLMSFRSEAGGMVRYPLYTNGRLAGTLTGWALWLAYTMNPPSESSALVQYMASYVPGVYSAGSLTLKGLGIASAFMFLFVLVNYYGVRIFARIINALTVLKLIVPILTTVTLIAVSFKFSNFTAEGFDPYGTLSIVSAIVSAGIVYSYLGFQAVINLSGEAKRPRRDGPIALILVIFFSMVFYVLLEIAFVGSLPAALLSHGWAGISLASPFADLAASFNLFWLYTLIIADSVYSPSGSSMAAVASNSRATYALAKDGFLPSFFARIDAGSGIPRRTLLFNFAISLIVLITLKSWHSIIEALGLLLLISFIGPTVSSAVIRKRPEGSAFRKGFYGIIQPAAFIFTGIILILTPYQRLITIISIFAVSIILQLLSMHGLSREDIKAGIWLPILFATFIPFSYMMGRSFSRLIIIALFIVVSALIYMIAVRSGEAFFKSAVDQKE